MPRQDPKYQDRLNFPPTLILGSMSCVRNLHRMNLVAFFEPILVCQRRGTYLKCTRSPAWICRRWIGSKSNSFPEWSLMKSGSWSSDLLSSSWPFLKHWSMPSKREDLLKNPHRQTWGTNISLWNRWFTTPTLRERYQSWACLWVHNFNYLAWSVRKHLIWDQKFSGEVWTRSFI